ncbi:MAG: indolepyruvate oxidoreductase subunit beta [Treponema sp.]|jgi:indolepyruvate ferredoxin oxidoreductase beta subunit|nr:indolepyruvate oxidoreductase subunit beta [Treponema sp.]
MNMPPMNCLITGVGGQGTVLISRLIGAAALARGCNVRGTETIGMAQRGGSVVSHIRFGGGPIHSPLIPPGRADLVIAFESAEALRTLPFLAPGGSMLVLNRGIVPAGAPEKSPSHDPARFIEELQKALAPSRLAIIDSEDLIRRCGSARVVNIALLGFAAEKLLPFTLEEFLPVLRERLPERHIQINERALDIGAEL